MAGFPEDNNLNIRRRRLPHYELAGSAYFVTWRLVAGSKNLTDQEKDLIVSALQHFHNDRYQLYAWVVMNDHVHVVFRPLGSFELGKILHSWKSFTANQLQKKSGRNGQVW